MLYFGVWVRSCGVVRVDSGEEVERNRIACCLKSIVENNFKIAVEREVVFEVSWARCTAKSDVSLSECLCISCFLS